MKELIRSTTIPTLRMTHLSNEQRELLPVAFGEFLETAATATARASFNNTRAEQEAAVASVHRDLFALDRGIYTAALLLPGLPFCRNCTRSAVRPRHHRYPIRVASITR